MKTALLGVLLASALAFFPSSALAACTTETIVIGGKMTVCTTCCYFGTCTTNCI